LEVVEAMSEGQMKCPTCGANVALGTLTCPNCGVNIRTGETYDARVKRAKPKDLHPERFHQSVYIGVITVFALVMLGGFLYQRRVETVIGLKPDTYAEHLIRMDEIDSLIAMGKTQEAVEAGQALVAELRKADHVIEIELAPTTVQRETRSRISKAVRRAEKSLLRNLVKKVEHKLAQIS